MCGIVGYVGPKPVLPVLDGRAAPPRVSRLRLGRRRARARRRRCRFGGARASSRTSKTCWRAIPSQGEFGIGHTRWATHGRPTEENAHPHRDCKNRVVVVHNGIIENYLELKRELKAAGHRFVTETDTEVVAHLVEKESRGDGLAAAVRRALRARARAVRARPDFRRRPGHDRRRPQRPAGRRRPRRRRVLRRVRYSRHPEPHARRSSFSTTARSPSSRRPACGSPTSTAGRSSKIAAAHHLGSGHGREGRLSALHAQGDPRAALGRAGDGARPDVASSRDACFSKRCRSTPRRSRRSSASSSSRAARRGTPGWWGSS